MGQPTSNNLVEFRKMLCQELPRSEEFIMTFMTDAHSTELTGLWIIKAGLLRRDCCLAGARIFARGSQPLFKLKTSKEGIRG